MSPLINGLSIPPSRYFCCDDEITLPKQWDFVPQHPYTGFLSAFPKKLEQHPLQLSSYEAKPPSCTSGHGMRDSSVKNMILSWQTGEIKITMTKLWSIVSRVISAGTTSLTGKPVSVSSLPIINIWHISITAWSCCVSSPVAWSPRRSCWAFEAVQEIVRL